MKARLFRIFMASHKNTKEVRQNYYQKIFTARK
jgi:hypothetical protein